MLYKFELSAPRADFYEITGQVREAVADSVSRGAQTGIAVVYCPHTSAGITINESYDPDVACDMLLGLERAFPDRSEFRHAEGNSAAHLKASAVGSSVTLIIEDGAVVLGTWQGVYFCEFDPPRERVFYVRVIAG